MTIEEFARMIVSQFSGARVSSMHRPGAVTATTGRPSLHGAGRAVDISAPTSIMQAIFDFVYSNRAALGVQEVIYRHQIWNARGLHRWEPRDHYDHVHIGLTAGAVGSAPPSASPLPSGRGFFPVAEGVDIPVPVLIAGAIALFLILRD